MPQSKAGKKAISPIIATIIILLVTIAIAGAGYSYISTYWSGLVGKQIEVINAFCTGDNQGKVMVKNIGNNPVRTGEITIINPNTGEDLTQDVSWAPSVSDPNLVLELKFEEGSGTIAKDTSGQGNDGTLYGDTIWMEGRVGKALSFDGSGDYVNIGNNYPLNTDFTDLTISFWMYADAANTDSGLVGKGTTVYGTTYHTGGLLYFYISGAGNVNAPVATGDWHHIAGTFEGGTMMKLYVDGNEVASKGPTAISSTGTGGIFRVGMATTNFDGKIDEVRVYNWALTPDEIKSLAENSVLVQPGETATLTHACSGRCRYNLVLGGAAKEAMLEC